MDGTSPTQQYIRPAIEQQGKKMGIFTIAFVGIILVLLFLVLNYFNVLRLSEIFPNYLGFLPHKEVSNGTSQQSQQPAQSTGGLNNVSPLKISCPSVKEFCEKGQGIVKDGKYIGFGYKLASGSAIFATFDGNLTATFSAYPIEVNGKTTLEKFKTLYLDSPDLNLRGVYYFRGQLTKTGPVIKGEQIAISNGKPIKAYDNNSFIFSLIPGYPAANTPAILNKEDFE